MLGCFSARDPVVGILSNGLRRLPPTSVGEADLGGRLGPTWTRGIVCVCLRTASVEWNVSGKYGPHGELFFFLIQKEPATMPGVETFSPFINADIRTPLFSAEVLKTCALVALHVIAEEGRDGDGCQSPWSGGRMEHGLPEEPNAGE